MDIILSNNLTSSSALPLSHQSKLYDIRLTDHFTLSEFLRSATATAKKIDNTPSLEVVSNLQQLCINVLEPARQKLGKAIVVTSGYRSQTLNKAIGGVSNSQHLTGEAADLRYDPQLFDILKTLPHDQLILERGSGGSWIHISYRQNGKNRHQQLSIKA